MLEDWGTLAMSKILLKGMPFDVYLKEYKIFEKTMQFMMECLENWHRDDPEQFQRDMRADHQTVVATYRFNRKFAAIKQNCMFEPLQRYISASMDILDRERNYVAIYTAFFDFDGNCFDDQLTT